MESHTTTAKSIFTSELNKIVGRYDPATNAIDWMIGTGENTTHMVMLNKDGSKMFTANIGSDSISILERGANPLNWNATVVPVGKGPEGMDISPDGAELWAAHSKDGGVSIIDIASKKVTATLQLGTKRSNRLKFTPDGKTVLITDLDAGVLIVLDRATRKEVKRITMGKTPEGILITPDGSRAYVGVAGDNHVARCRFEYARDQRIYRNRKWTRWHGLGRKEINENPSIHIGIGGRPLKMRRSLRQIRR